MVFSSLHTLGVVLPAIPQFLLCTIRIPLIMVTCYITVSTVCLSAQVCRSKCHDLKSIPYILWVRDLIRCSSATSVLMTYLVDTGSCPQLPHVVAVQIAVLGSCHEVEGLHGIPRNCIALGLHYHLPDGTPAAQVIQRDAAVAACGGKNVALRLQNNTGLRMRVFGNVRSRVRNTLRKIAGSRRFVHSHILR